MVVTASQPAAPVGPTVTTRPICDSCCIIYPGEVPAAATGKDFTMFTFNYSHFLMITLYSTKLGGVT